MKLAIGYGIAAAVGLLPELTAAASPATTGLPNNGTYRGCYSERLFSASGPRMINYNLTRNNGNGATFCINYCAKINPLYRFVATNDNQCWCDVQINTGADYGTKLSESMCTKECRQNTAEICGNEKGKNNNDNSTQYANMPTAASVYEYTYIPVSGFPYACVLVLCAFFVLVAICLWIGQRQKRKDRMEGSGRGQVPRPYERLENGSSRTACKGGVDEEDGLLRAAGRDSETQSGAAGWGRRFGRSSLFR